LNTIGFLLGGAFPAGPLLSWQVAGPERTGMACSGCHALFFEQRNNYPEHFHHQAASLLFFG
jgi:hypothetical protein